MKEWNTFSVGRMNRLVHDTIVEPQGRDAGRHSQAQRIIHSKEINCGDSRQSKVKFMNRQLQRRLWYNILAPKPWDLHMLPQWLSSLMTTFLKWRLAFLGIQLGHAWKYVWNWSYFKQNSREPTLSKWATPNENTDRCQDLWSAFWGALQSAYASQWPNLGFMLGNFGAPEDRVGKWLKKVPQKYCATSKLVC